MVRGCQDDNGAAGPSSGGGWACVRPAHRSLSARASRPLLSRPRLRPRREDALQETLLSAWRGLGDFEERSTLRTWLYRIATSRCLDALRAASRRPQMDAPIFTFHPPEPTRMGEVLWLDPYPDLLIDGLTDPAPGPESRYEAREAISLAFVTALQLLPPRQRVVLVLRDVLGFAQVRSRSCSKPPRSPLRAPSSEPGSR